MDEIKLDLVRVWMIKALHDLDAAKTLASGKKNYWTQRLFTVNKRRRRRSRRSSRSMILLLKKTHDCRLLAQKVLPHHLGIKALFPQARLLTPYAVIFRYPFGPIFPDRAEFDEALKAAEAIVTFVMNEMPREALPEPDQ